MPIQTDLSVSPYFDDYLETKDYYKILFRPGVAVQARELNQLQTILQKQIERFGDNVFKRGTIIDGCNITFHQQFPFVKIRDNETDGAPVNISQYVSYYLKGSQANLQPLTAVISTAISGFESRNPDLNTLYVKYVSSGFSNVAGVSTQTATTYVAGEQLTVYDPRSPIEKVTSYNDSSGFSNTDSIVFVSALAIQNTTGGTIFANNFYVSDYINDGTANVQIVEVDTTSNSQVVILRIKPKPVDLQSGNTDLWTFDVNTNIVSTNAAPSSTANVVAIIGSGAAATLKTGALGEVDQVTVTAKGTGYYVLPTVWVSSPGATTGQIATANLVAQNYLTKITVANSSVNPTGVGYAVTVGEGIIYQKGYFSRVNEHLVVVEKYANTPNQKSVGFNTQELIINSNQDQSLLDNATGAPNATAPGANRLKLAPSLIVLSKAEADANSEFFSIVEFSEGKPYKQNRQTVYNVLGNEMARRTFEESGNYVIDPFLINTQSPSTLAEEALSFKIQVDPGKAYINGKRVETVEYYTANVAKGTNTFVSNNATISLNYGNYIRVKEVGGTFIFKFGETVSLYGTAAQYITSASGTTPSAGSLGTSLGTARMRSFVYESGTPGTADCVYRLYLFDVRLQTSRNFSLVRSIFYNGTNKGVADAVLEGGEAVMKDNRVSSLIYPSGVRAVKRANNLSYVYRTSANNLTLATNGAITFVVTGGETFPYTQGSTLSSVQERDVIVVPLANVQMQANISGSLQCNTTSPQINGTSTSFLTEVQAGDFLKINTTIVQVDSVANNTVLYATANASGAATSNAVIYFPQFVPVPLDRSTRTVNVNATSNSMVVYFGAAVNVATTVAITYNVRSSNTTPVAKTVNRNNFIRLQLSNNATQNTGPWVLGIPDVFRLKKVYKGPNNSFLDTDTVNVSDVTQYFYCDHNQTEDYYGISYLYKKPNSNLSLSTSDFLLVKLDHFVDSAEGLKAPGISGTYDINDTTTLTSSTSTVNTLEVPEVYGLKGDYYDLRDTFDFRPQSSNTVAANSSAANAPLNPVEPSDTARFNAATDKKFPAPDSTLQGTIEYYVGRVDRVVIDENNQFFVVQGTPGNYTAPPAPDNALTISLVSIPPYPSVPRAQSNSTIEFIGTNMANEKYTAQRLKTYSIQIPQDLDQRRITQPRGYTMVDIGKLERRIRDLEYYTSLSFVETQTQKRVIPSSSNVAVERFKFGFFVDSFNNYQYSDINNPGYRASIVDGYLSPKVNEINLILDPTQTQGITTLPLIEYTYIQQTRATDGPVTVVVNEPITTITANTPAQANVFTGTITILPTNNVVNATSNAVVVQTTTSVRQKNKTSARSDVAPYVYEDFYYTMSATAGPVSFFLNSRNNRMALEVSQSQSENGPWTSVQTSASAQAIQAADVTNYQLTSMNNEPIEHLGTLSTSGTSPVGTFINDQFKLIFTHNPDSGLYYRFRVYKGGNSAKVSNFGSFEYKLFYPVDSDVNNTATGDGFTPTTNYLFNYMGAIRVGVMGPNQIGDTYWGQYVDVIYSDGYSAVGDFVVGRNFATVPTEYITAEQALDVVVTGLKPFTVHVPYLDGQNILSRCKQVGKLLGQDLQSDASGTIQFKLYFGSDLNPQSDVEKAAMDVLRIAGVKTLKLESADGSSSAKNTLQIPSFVKEQSITPPEPPALPAITQESYAVNPITSRPILDAAGGGRIEWSADIITADY